MIKAVLLVSMLSLTACGGEPVKTQPAAVDKLPHQRIYMLAGVDTTGTTLTKASGVEIWCVDGYKYAYFDGDKSGGPVAMMRQYRSCESCAPQPARCEE